LKNEQGESGMMTHTPGPWTIYIYEGWHLPKGGDFVGKILGPNDEPVYAGPASFHAIKKFDDAYLIAAAPDLLEACEALINTPARDTKAIDRAWEMMRSAIAKAKGR
jgi:hypothetical protein